MRTSTSRAHCYTYKEVEQCALDVLVRMNNSTNLLIAYINGDFVPPVAQFEQVDLPNDISLLDYPEPVDALFAQTGRLYGGFLYPNT